MPQLPYPTYLDHIRRESARFREVLTGCDPDARVPSCPDWDASDLVWHLAEVQLFWSRVVRLRPATPRRARDRRPPAGRPAGVVRRAARGLRRLLARAGHRARARGPRGARLALVRRPAGGHQPPPAGARGADPPGGRRADRRRTGHPRSIPPLADDGVAEVLGVMYGGCPPWGTFTPSGEHLAVRMSDTGTGLLVALGTFDGTDPDSGTTYTDEDDISLVESGAAPVTTITGTAADLDAWLWKRGPADAIEVDGDRHAYEKLTTILAQPLN